MGLGLKVDIFFVESEDVFVCPGAVVGGVFTVALVEFEDSRDVSRNL